MRGKSEVVFAIFVKMKIELSEEESEPLIENEEDLVPHKRKAAIDRNNSTHTKNRHHRILLISSVFAFLLFVHVIIFSNVKNLQSKREVLGWSKNTSRETSDYIFPNENTTLIEPPNLCRTNESIFLLIVVCSSAGNFEARQTIRETWGNTSRFNYPLFQKLHSSHNYLSPNSKSWKQYVEVISLLICTHIANMLCISVSHKHLSLNTKKTRTNVRIFQIILWFIKKRTIGSKFSIFSL